MDCSEWENLLVVHFLPPTLTRVQISLSLSDACSLELSKDALSLLCLFLLKKIRERLCKPGVVSGFILPNRSIDISLVTDPEESIGSRSYVKISWLLIGKEGIWDPNSSCDFWSDVKILDPGKGFELQPSVIPTLTEIKVTSEVLCEYRWREEKKMICPIRSG